MFPYRHSGRTASATELGSRTATAIGQNRGALTGLYLWYITVALACASIRHFSFGLLVDLLASKVQVMSAGALALRPRWHSFRDSVGGTLVAIDTGDRKAVASAAKIYVLGIDEKIAALVGVTPDQILHKSLIFRLFRRE